MFCPECGKQVPEDASFCPACGRYLSYNGTQTVTPLETPEPQQTCYEPPAPADSFFRRNSTKLIAVAIVLLVITAVFILPMFNGHGKLYGRNFSTETDEDVVDDAGDARTAVLTDGFVNGGIVIATLSFEEDVLTETDMDDMIHISLNSEIASEYDTFSWAYATPVTDTSFVSGPLDKSSINFQTEKFGKYSFTLTCKNSASHAENSYSFNIRIDDLGFFEWTFEDGDFQLSMHFKHEDYEAYSPAKGTAEFDARDVYDWGETPSFVKDTDGSVAAIEKKLRQLYTDAFGSCTEDQDYADFILCFVQESFDYKSDFELYHTENDYFAYPIEVIYNHAGDCEDTSILCSAIYKVAGYSTAVLIIPNHAMTAVALDTYAEPSLDYNGYILSGKTNGKLYYAGETTADSYQPVGASYAYEDGHPYTYYLNKGIIGQGSYTFYEVVRC